MKVYPPKPSSKKEEGGFTYDEVKRGVIWLYADVTCTECGKEQSAAMAGSTVDGTCIKCGGRTA
jgi:hypothetical protein